MHLSQTEGLIRNRLISVVGGTDASPEEYSRAETLGGLLAGGGFTVVCGGGSGVMEAVCRGAAEAGGRTIGILPGEDPMGANRYVETVIATGMGTSRNRIIALSGMAMVAVGGRYGTLSEIAFALQAGRPVCAMGGWSGIPGVAEVESPEEAIRFINDRTGDTDAQR
ncbi:MAG: TIGR00725 family protein [Candidatus Aegiribacteria sp.]